MGDRQNLQFQQRSLLIGLIMEPKAPVAILEGHSEYMTTTISGKQKLVKFARPDESTRFFNDAELLKLNEIICSV